METQLELPWFKGNPKEFSFKPCVIAGDDCVLIIPRDEKALGKWFEHDKIYRSSIWRVSDGAPISLGYKKFVNFTEQPEFDPIQDCTTWIAVEKVDGSCLICSKYKNEYIFRTRGTISAFNTLDNSDELPGLIEKYNLKKLLDDYPDVTFIFEWVSPRNVLCITYPEADLYFTGAVNQFNYDYFRQSELNSIAAMYKLKRPRLYGSFENADAVSYAVQVKDWINAEGVVCYFDDGQTLKKMKSNWHLAMHIARSKYGNISKLIDYMFEKDIFSTSKDDFPNKLRELDWEILNYWKNKIEEIYNIYHKEIAEKVNEVSFLFKTKNVTTPYDVLALLKESSIKDTIFWSVFRNVPLKKTFIKSTILDYVKN